MNRSRIKVETILYIAAFGLALLVRLVSAAQHPLTNAEADLALQSLAQARGQNPLLGPQPAYLALTTLLMYLFSSGDWVARFWPALTGSLLVLLPALFRSRLGRFPAVLLAFFLAFDPGLLAVSRQAGSPSLALFFTLLALGLWLNRRYSLAGVAFGLILLGGPSIWPGWIALAAALWTIGYGWRSQPAVEAETRSEESPAAPSRPDVLYPLGFALVTALLVGTLFFTIRDGISTIGASITTYLSGWVPASTSTGLPVGLFLLALLLYEFLPLFFGLWGGVSALPRRGPTNVTAGDVEVDRFLLVWWVIALILAVAYPARQAPDLAWSLVPLWGLAARQIARLVHAPADDRLPILGEAALTAVLLAFASMAVVSMVNSTTATTLESRVRLGGALIMLAATTGLVAWGWSRQVALRGLGWGIGLVLLVYSVAMGWNASGLAGRMGEELWVSGLRVTSADLIDKTLGELQMWSTPMTGGPDMVVVGVPSSALRWQLRDVPRISFVDQLPGGASPAIVITPDRPDLALAASYRGERFILSEGVNWSQIKPVDWFRWLVFRSVPVEQLQQERVVLWARSDLFPGGVLQTGLPALPSQGNPPADRPAP